MCSTRQCFCTSNSLYETTLYLWHIYIYGYLYHNVKFVPMRTYILRLVLGNVRWWLSLLTIKCNINFSNDMTSFVWNQKIAWITKIKLDIAFLFSKYIVISDQKPNVSAIDIYLFLFKFFNYSTICKKVLCLYMNMIKI